MAGQNRRTENKRALLQRVGRSDIAWSVNALAREVANWTTACAKGLHPLVAYIHHQLDAIASSVGDHPEDCFLVLFSDASFAGDLKDSKSTTGGFLCLVGPSTCCPITWLCKKPGAISHSISEAEENESTPSLISWDLVFEVFTGTCDKQFRAARSNLLRRERDLHLFVFDVDFVPPSVPTSSGRAQLYLLEDNDAVIKMTIKGRSPNMRHFQRTRT